MGISIRARSLVSVAVLALSSAGCTGVLGGSDKGSGGPMLGSAGSSSAGAAGTGGVGAQSTSTGGVKLRLLTQAEYQSSLQSLLGTLTTKLALPDDTSVAGFVAVGASQVTVGELAAEAYETASRAATAEVFGDDQRWPGVVGCMPQADLSDACVTTFVQSFGKRAFRRELTDEETQQWVGVARSSAQVAASAAQGLAAAASGLLQSPNFLYRVETNALDVASGRLKYDGLSMASRLSFLLNGAPPSTELMASVASGQLDTADGVRAAAAQLLSAPDAPDRMTQFFSELAEIQQVLKVQKDQQLFPAFNAALQSSMLQATQLFIKNVVLAPGADVRSYFDSNQTYVDASLAALYGVSMPSSGFAQVQLGPETGRAGILGQAGFIAATSQPDRTSPTRRGFFILSHFICQTPPPPPPGVITLLPQDPNTTTRQKMEMHRTSASCAGCHALMDPLGFALEHFDPIGRYRPDENGHAIDATGSIDNIPFDGAAGLGAALRQDQRASACMLRSFYRHANGRTNDDTDTAQIDALGVSLASHAYVWRDLVADFVASDAFRSAPATPVMSGMP